MSNRVNVPKMKIVVTKMRFAKLDFVKSTTVLNQKNLKKLVCPLVLAISTALFAKMDARNASVVFVLSKSGQKPLNDVVILLEKPVVTE